MNTPNAPHVVFGAGAIGRTLAATLHASGHRVRIVNRTGRAAVPPGVRTVAADVAADPDAAVRAAADAAVVYQVLNPPYHRWPQEFPGLQAAVLCAAERAGARLVAMDNVYAYGAPDGGPFTEDTPYRAHTRKGRVRAGMARELHAAADAGRVEIAIGRASNYFGPGGGVQAVNLGDQALLAALTGGRAQVVGDPDQPHSYSYIPDIAAGLAALGTSPDAAGRVWHLPNDTARTTREVLDLAYRTAGHDRARITRVPRGALRALGVVRPVVREVLEMVYEFEQPFVVDSARIADELGVHPTPLVEALRHTLDGYR